MKLGFRRRLPIRQSVKESFDNLPAGVCFFDENGIPILCNRQMHRLSHLLSGRDLQMQQEIEEWLLKLPKNSRAKKDGEVFLLDDNTAWCFDKHKVTGSEGVPYTEFIASNVTELYHRKLQLEEGVSEQQKILKSIENISSNIAIITRNEESLKLKMKIHNDLGAALNFARLYLSEGCPAEEKAAFIARQKDMSQILLSESNSDEDNDPLSDLNDVAEGLGIKIEINGDFRLNAHLRRLVSYALRECLTNTVRHAQGDTVYMKKYADESNLYIELTNNGNSPKQEIAEGGGLSSLREKMKRCGGTMSIQSLPRFVMKITLPLDAKDY